MLTIWSKLTARPGDDRGASIVEYALIIAFIAMVCFAVVAIIGGQTSSVFDSAGAGFP